MNVLTLVGGGAALLASLAAHESAHAAAARILPGATVEGVGVWPRAYVDYSVDKLGRVSSAVSLAPTILGLVAGVVALGTVGIPAGPPGVLAVLCWGAFTLPSTDDIHPRAIGEALSDSEIVEARALQGLILAMAGWATFLAMHDTSLRVIGLGIAAVGVLLGMSEAQQRGLLSSRAGA